MGTAQGTTLTMARVHDDREAESQPMEGSRTTGIDTVLFATTPRVALILGGTVDDTAAFGCTSVARAVNQEGSQQTSVPTSKQGEIASTRVIVPASYSATINFYPSTPPNGIMEVLRHTQLPATRHNFDLGAANTERGGVAGSVYPATVQPHTRLALPREFGSEQDDSLDLDHPTGSQYPQVRPPSGGHHYDRYWR